jgi:hypothetical protein
LLKDIYKVHENAVDTKKDYLTVLSVPANDVIQLYASKSSSKDETSKEPSPSKDSKLEEYHSKLKLPKTVLF